jgi:hypothetical protein
MRLNVTLKERILRLKGLKTSYQDASLSMTILGSFGSA